MILKIKLVITDETKWVAWGACRVLEVFGYNNHTADNYIQFFESPIVANGDVPAVAGLFAPTAAPFGWKFADPIPLSELLIAISSTEVNYTALTNQGLDMTAIVETDCPVTANTTLVGDLTTGVAEKQIWSEANGATTPKKLLRVDFKNNLGAVAYPYVSHLDTNFAKTSALRPLTVVADGATKSYFFGRNGYTPFSDKVTPGNYVKGCTIVASASGDINTTTLVGTNSFNIRGIYDI